jgi:transposase-like protein
MNLHELTSIVSDEAKAFQMVESLVWPEGPVCPHCDNPNKKQIYDLSSVRVGLKKCGACRKQFTVRVGTIFEDSHIPLGKWLIAIHMMCSSKKGVSAAQLQRQLGLSYKSAWFMCHRVRLAMTLPPMRGMLGGGSHNIVEVDETYIGGKRKNNPHRNHKPKPKAIVMTLIERGGNVHTQPVKNTLAETVKGVVIQSVAETAHIVTDQLPGYKGLNRRFASHETVNHEKEFVRGLIHTNFAESYHSLLKRGILGTFHHVSRQHLPRYLNEFSFRWNNRKVTDGERAEQAVRQIVGKRLRYTTPVRRGASSLA